VSILAVDFTRLGEPVGEAEGAGADRIHVDVMGGHFVRNISMGAPIVASLRPATRLPLETHLTITDPDLFLQEIVEAGSDSFLVHWEANLNLHRTVHSIKDLGKGVEVVINPATPVSVLEEILPEVDGGIDPETAPLAVEAGADVLVAGTAVFGDRDGVTAGMKTLRASIGL
jgi:ribulose-phosphate 3-epimerase